MPALYRCRAAKSELEDLFDCRVPIPLEWGSTFWLREKAPIVRLENGQRIFDLMEWGMPVAGTTGRPVRWAERFSLSRQAFHAEADEPLPCLIPADFFALPDGRRGRRTRTWFGLWDEPIFAWAGLWRDIEDHGRRFMGAACAANLLVARVGQSMPAILWADEYDLWLKGSCADRLRLWRRPHPEERMWMERTHEIWSTGFSLEDAEVLKRPRKAD